MTQSAAEVFITQLARASAKQANGFLRARGLQSSDRDDVISAAMLWCWTNRNNYSLTTTLETWFMNAVRDAYKSLQRGELSLSDDSIENLGGGDVTYNIVEAESSVAAISAGLTRTERRIAVMTMEGYTKADMLDRGVREIDIRDARSTIKRMRELLPDESNYRILIRTPSATPSDDLEDSPSSIDIELEQLDFAPPAGKDCPPCWRCCYFLGFLPDGKRSTRMDIVDPEVLEAVSNTESRKIEIAQQVRNGS
jgi:hypothetical protein